MKNSVLRITVGVLSFDRVEELRQLLPRLVAQAESLDASGETETTVLVIDSDPYGSGRRAASGAGDRVRYVHEERPGIAAARARAVDECASGDLLVFLDDDERPTAGWLAALVDTWRRHGQPAGVAGRITPTYDGPADPWIEAGGFFARPHHPTGTPVPAASTANLLLDLAALRRLGLNFDAGLGLRGGEDTKLTRSLTRAGERVVWSDEAEVVDPVPAQRMTRRWVLTRAFHHGAGTSRIDIELSARPRVARVGLIVLGLVRTIVLGPGQLSYGLLTRNLGHRARGLRLGYRGAGMVAGALDLDRAEYRAAPVRRADGGTFPPP